jgi:murein DD-endopeptidase MepM/ murein hydrolase activator NlpD
LNRLDQASEIHSGEFLRVPAGARSTREAVFSEALDREAHNYAPPPRTASVPAPQPGGAFARDLMAAESASASNSERAVQHAYLQHQSGEHLAFAWPLRGPVISPFGAGGDGERNDGINIAAEQGTPIRAAAAGTVTYAGNELKGYGNLILIAHDDGYVTAYAHAQSMAVDRGDRVDRGQVIGAAGATGGVRQPQLHFEIRRGIRPVDPGLLLTANR